MAVYYKYEKFQKYINGVPQDEYKQGELIGTGEYSSLEDCEKNAIYRWVDSGETVCDGYKLCVKEVKEKSLDGGDTWTRTDETRPGQVIEMWSTDCGVVIMYQWNPTGVTACKAFHKQAEYVYQVSYTMGTTWEDVEPRQTKWVVTDAFSDECMIESDPFTFTFEAGLEGGKLDINTTMEALYSYWTQDDSKYDSMTGRYSINYFANVYTKYAIDWDDGAGPQIYESTIWEQTSDSWSRLEEKPESPFATTALKNPMKIPSYVYRTGGTKTIKIWGNINYFGCRQVNEFIHWGVDQSQNHYNALPEDLLKMLQDKGTQVCSTIGDDCLETPLVGAKVERSTNFNKIETSFQGTGFGTMYTLTFNYLQYFDMSGSNNITYPNPYSRFRNCKKLKTFIADNCANMTNTPQLNIDDSVLENISFKNCPKLQYVNYVNMRDRRSDGGAVAGGINLTPDGVFENCLEIEELDFGYNVFVHNVNLTYLPKLKKITGTLIQDQQSLTTGFYQMCKDMQSLTTIDNLSLEGNAYQAFYGCTNIRTICKSFKPYSSGKEMYAYSGINTIYDISKLYYKQNKGVDLSYMFKGSPLTEIRGVFNPDTQHMEGSDFTGMFQDCTSLATVPAIFSSVTTLPTLDYMFDNCKLSSVPLNFFNYNYTGENIIVPMYMFRNNHLYQYPIVDGIPMWKMPAFYDGTITKTMAILNNTTIAADFPPEWGGYKSVVPTIITVTTTEASEYVYYPEVDNQYTDDLAIMRIVSETYVGGNSSNGRLKFNNPGSYTVHIYPFIDSSSVRIPLQTVEIVDWGNATDIDCSVLALSSTGVVKIPYGAKLFSQIEEFIEPTKNPEYQWYQDEKIINIDDTLFANCGNVTAIGGKTGFFNMNLSNEKYEQMFKYLVNLRTAQRLFKKQVDSTCGIFKYTPLLANIQSIFRNQTQLVNIDPNELNDCPNLIYINYAFDGCTNLTTMPNFNGCKNIRQFSYAFRNCTSLTGSTPVDENGYKLWERAGKPGYPTTITGTGCFAGCTQLDDYDEIPSNWK